MSGNAKYTPMSTRETKSSSKHATSSCILRPPKPKDESASGMVCIYPLSVREEQTLEMFEEKHALQCTEFDSEALMVIITNMFHNLNSKSICLPDSGGNVGENTLPSENIHNIISQIRFNCDIEGDIRGTSLQILDVVQEYSWEAKMVLILAASLTNYGEFCFDMIRRTAINPYAKQKRSFLPTRETVSSHLTRLSNLFKYLLDITTVMLQFKKDKDKQDMADIESKVTKMLHSVIYQIIKVGVACSSYVELVYEDIKNITLDTEIQRQECFLNELLENRKNLTDYLDTIDREANENFTPVEYRDIRIFFTKLFTKEKELNAEIVLDEIKGYTTAFLISGVNVRIENFTSLIETHKNIPKEKNFRVVWIPITDKTVEWTDAEEKSFCKIAGSMPWCCCHPLMLTKAFSTHIVKNWQYKKDPSLVVLNEKAEVITTDALSVVEMWGDKAYPFSSDMVSSISKCWTIKSTIEDWEIDQIDWESDIVCIYGGYNLELIKSFTKCVESIKHTSNHVQIKAIYVGTNRRKENMDNIISSLEKVDMKCLSKPLMVSFWNRLCIILKTRLGDHEALDEDVVIEQVTTLLGYNKEELWTTMIYQGSIKFVTWTGSQLLQNLEVLNGSNREFKTTNEFFDCLLQNTKPENHTMLAISAAACKRVEDLFGSEQQDVTEVLAKVFINKMGIFEGQKGLEHFKGRSVAFLVTKMDAKTEEVTSLVENYKQIHQGAVLNIIWIPICDKSEELRGTEVEKSFAEKAISMGWYYCHPLMLTKDFSTYITKDSYSQTRSTLLTLNLKGKLVSTLQWFTSTFPWEYQVEKETWSKLIAYCPAKELTVFNATKDVDWKMTTVPGFDGIRDVHPDVIEILAPVRWAVRHTIKASALVPNTVYESIFLVMLTDQAQGWETPVSMQISFRSDGLNIDTTTILNHKPREWFEVILGEFTCTQAQCDGEILCAFYSYEAKKKGIMIRGAGVQEKKK